MAETSSPSHSLRSGAALDPGDGDSGHPDADVADLDEPDAGDDAAGAFAPLTWDVTPVEADIIDFFVHLAATLSLPKSIGELFGFLYCAADPLPFEEIVSRLGISKGSASQGLRFLQSLNAVETVYQARDRRTFYRAEASLRRLITGLLDSKVVPHLQTAEDRLDAIGDRLAQQAGDPALASRDLLGRRLEALQQWHRTARRFLPLIARMTAPPKGKRK